ncbi:UNVERIFIED_CONTAM: hypothetical protein HDU68_006433 [Siphonaria sp. JEL0065]|nr:hypothetical protein HDU68_006433 [Siphonaria sp. JEL0065]
MLLLSPTEVETAVSSVAHGSSLLMQVHVRRHLFYLGGVPRWAFEYISLLLTKVVKKLETTGKDILSIEEIEDSFIMIKCQYVNGWGGHLTDVDFLKLSAYCVVGVSVEVSARVVGGVKRTHSSRWLLTDDSQVLIPYSIFLRVGNMDPQNYSESEGCFIMCVRELIDKVDAQVYDKPLWALWEVFGAYFHALRINAMIIVGRPVVKLSALFKGALVCGCDEEVELLPTKVIEYDDKFGSSIGKEIGRKGRVLEKHDWLKEGLVVINGEDGEGVDIFFALKKKGQDRYIICLDQRKRVAGSQDLLSSARIFPAALGDVTVVPLLFSSLVSTNVKDLPSDAVVVTYAQLQSYHGGLWLHPASSPCVNVNRDPVSYIKMVLTGTSQDIQRAANGLIEQREKRSFETIESIADAVQKISKRVQLSNQERIVFR